MAQSAQMVSSTLTNATVVLRFLGTSPGSSNLRRLLHSVCQQIVYCYGKDRTSVPEDFDDLKSFFLECLKLATKQKPLVVILDSLDQLNRDHNALRLHWLPRKLPENVSLLISTYTEASELINILKSMFAQENFINVPVFSQELSIEVLRSWLTKGSRTLTAEQFSLVESAFVKCSLPLFVKLIYDQVLQWPSYKPIDQCRLSYTVQASIESLFSLLEKKHGPELVNRALAYLTASQSGLSETELEDLLSIDDDVLNYVFQIHVPPVRRIPPLLWVRIRHDISQYLVEKEVDEVRSFFWYHRQFFETAQNRYLTKTEERLHVHSMMADYYLGKWYGVEKPFRYTAAQMKKLGLSTAESAADRRISAQPLIFSESGTKVRYNKRKLNKLPFHLFQANRIEELRSVCLFNYKWNETKLRGVSLQELLLDLSMCGEQDGMLYKAFKASQSTLRSHPDTLSMEISGRLLALLQTEATPAERRLLDDALVASAETCKLVPYQPCFGIPSESEVYSIENSQIPIAPKPSPISSDSTRFAAQSSGNSVLIWDLQTGELETTLNLLDEDGGNLNVMVKPLRKDVLILGSTHQLETNPVFIVNLHTASLEQQLTLDKLYPKIPFLDNLKFDLTDKYLLVVVVKQAADVFDRTSGKLVHEFEGEPDIVELIADDTMILLHPKQTNMFTIYKMESFEFVYQVSCTETPRDIYINDHADFGCIVMEKSNVLSLINLAPAAKLGEITARIDLSNKTNRTNLKIQTVQMQVGVCLVTTNDGFLVIDLKTTKVKHDIQIPDRYKPSHRVIDFRSVLTSDGKYIVLGYDKYILLYAVKDGKLIHGIEASKSRIIHLHVDRIGEFIVTSNSRNNRLTCWRLSSLKSQPRSYQPLSMSNSVRYMAVNRSGTTAVLRGMSPTDFAVIDVDSGQIRCMLSKDYEAMMPSITVDGKYAVLREYDSDECLKVWDTQSGTLVSTMKVSSLFLKAYVLGTRPENMITMVESNDSSGQHTLTLCKLPSGNETGVKIHCKKYNMLQVFFAKNDSYLIVGIEEHTPTGVKIYSRSYLVSTGAEHRTYDKVHPKYIQMITPDSDCFLGQHIHTDNSGKESWESILIHIETGATMVKLETCPNSHLAIGWLGNYGIETNRKVYDLRSGKVVCEFDPDLGEPKKSVARPVITEDEKYVLWIDPNAGLLKVGDIETNKMIGMSPIHSTAMNLEITPQSVIMMGCEDGRLMMLQLMTQNTNLKQKVDNIFRRSMKKAVKAIGQDKTVAALTYETKKTMVKAKQSMDKMASSLQASIPQRKPNTTQDRSRACVLL